MIRRISLLLFAACTLLAAPTNVRADVREDPLKLRLVERPAKLAPGEPDRLTFELSSAEATTIDAISLTGAGWSVRVVDSPAGKRVAKGASARLRVEVAAADLRVPLVLAYVVGGRSFERSLDLSPLAPDAKPRMRSVRSVPGAQPQPAGRNEGPSPTLREDAPLPPGPGGEVRVRRAKAAPGTKSVTARNIRVHGRFVYTRQDGQVIGADGVAVRVYDEDTGPDEMLAEVAANIDGTFDINVNWDPCFLCDGTPDLYVEFETDNSVVNVQEASLFEPDYTWATGTWGDFGGSDLDVGTVQPADDAQLPALHIATDIVRGWRWYLNREGYTQEEIDVQWPDGDAGAWYNPFYEEIHVGLDRSWNEATHLHEYGHHFVENFAVGVSPDYCNGICDTPDCGHCVWCRETDHDAWAEGWPNWIADIQTKTFLADYGLASMNTRDAESVQMCGAAFDDPLRTEGFLQALVQDVSDAANDDDPGVVGNFPDALSLGTDEIFDVVDFDEPTTPLGFIASFGARFPSHRENLWSTAMNNGYQVDATNPNAVTNLVCTSHAVGIASPNPRITFTWTRATDDWSGVGGYGITVGASAGLPSAVVDLANVTTFTTSTLAPGSYFFSIRAQDRAGRWSGSFASIGPIVIRAPEPANLAKWLQSGWGAETVPRGAADATFGSTPLPTSSLPGNAAQTRWNLFGVNDGESATSTGFTSRLYVDGIHLTGASWGSVLAGQSFFANNWGPVTVRGGRHTWITRVDALDQIAETDEDDNGYGRQFVWSPLTLTPNASVTRSAPPPRTEWTDATGTLGYNCDGLRFGAPTGSWWNLVWLKTDDFAQDFDCRLHFTTASADTGFNANRGWSTRLGGQLDAVLANRNTVGAVNWDVGVIQWTGTTSAYTARHVTSQSFAWDDSIAVTMPANEYAVVRELYVAPGNVGPVSVVVDHDPALGDVHVSWYDRTFTTGALSSAGATAISNATGRARLDVNVATSGFYGVVIWRDPSEGSGVLPMTIEMGRTPPNFQPFRPAGWHSAFVPRPANDGTGASVPLPDTLLGNAASTYLNFAVQNTGPMAADGLLGQVYLDGVYTWYLAYGSFPALGSSLFNWNAGWTVRGGRHTLGVYYDQVQTIEESLENDNVWGEQWIWGPLQLTAGATYTRSAPPDRTGGWTEITSGEANFWNSDGVRTPLTVLPGNVGNWCAVASMPSGTGDVDLRMHEAADGTKSGFGPSYGVSAWGPGQSDFVLVNFNRTSSRRFDVGVLRGATGTASAYTTESVGSTYLGSSPVGTFGPYSIAANHIVRLHEVNLIPGTWLITLVPADQRVDWGLSLYDGVLGTFLRKSTTVANGAAWENGEGGEERVQVSITTAGRYCVAAWKSASADLADASDYRLDFRMLTTDAPDERAFATALAPATPNPSASSTVIPFTLAHEGPASLVVYDLQGARVRTLAEGKRSAGAQRALWDGADDAGRRVAPGVYLVRLETPGRVESRKVIRVN